MRSTGAESLTSCRAWTPRGILWLSLLCAGVGSCPLGAFSPPVRISSGGGQAAWPGISAYGTAALATFVEEGALMLRVVGAESRAIVEDGVSSDAPPRLAVGPLGRVGILYLARPAGGGDAAAELWLVERIGGSFTDPVELASGLSWATGYALGYRPQGFLDLAWTVPAAPPGSTEIQLLRGGEPVFSAAGEGPQIFDAPSGFTHIGYLRGGRIYYRTDREDGGFSVEHEVPQLTECARFWLTADGAERAHFAVQAPGGIWAVSAQAGSFSEPVLVAARGVDPRIVVSRSDRAGVSFLEDGALFLAAREPGGSGFSPPVTVALPSEAGAVDSHSLAVDDLGYHHAAWEQGGEIYYSTEVPAPTAFFEASAQAVLQGEELVFKDLSAGVVTGRSWNLGDGTVADDDEVRHRYLQPGRYEVTLTVWGPGGEGMYVLPAGIRVSSAPNVLAMEDISAPAGAQDVTVPILLTNAVPCRGYQVVVSLPEGIEYKEASTDGTVTEILRTEFLDTDVVPVDGGLVVVTAALWDYALPFDDRLLEPGSKQGILVIRFRLAAHALPGAVLPLEFINNFGTQEASNLLVTRDASQTLFPFTRDGSVSVVEAGNGPFIRGDANADGDVDISDAIAILKYLFLGSARPRCLDAADRNDDGAVDISDSIDVLQFLFGGTFRFPPYPYPGPGLDPTPDALPPCS